VHDSNENAYCGAAPRVPERVGMIFLEKPVKRRIDIALQIFGFSIGAADLE